MCGDWLMRDGDCLLRDGDRLVCGECDGEALGIASTAWIRGCTVGVAVVRWVGVVWLRDEGEDEGTPAATGEG